MPRDHCDYFERLPINEHRFVDWTCGGKQRVGHIVAKHTDVCAPPRFELVEKAAFLKIERRGDDVIGNRSPDQNVADFVVRVFDAPVKAGSRHCADEVRVWCRANHAIERLGILGLDLFSVAIIPPVIHILPRPLCDIENVVTEHRHALVESSLDSIYRCAHQRDRDNADDDA